MPDTNQKNSEKSKVMEVINRSQKTVDNLIKKYSSPIRYEPLKKEKNEVKIEYEPLKKEKKKEYEIYKTKGITKEHEQYKLETYQTKGIAKAHEKYKTDIYATKGKAVAHREYKQLMRTPNPYMAHMYRIEIDGKMVGGFSEIGAIEISSEMGEYNEGGQNIYPYHYVKKIKYSNIVLKRGLTKDTYLWDWYQDVIMGKISKRDIAIILTPGGKDKPSPRNWTVLEAFPVKWSGSAFNAGKGDVLIESLELVHSGIFIGED